ncbi:MAG: hypothetical protein AABX19_04845 [Nanoarchaeota archaeon]
MEFITKVYKMSDKLAIYFPKNRQIYYKGVIILVLIIKQHNKIEMIAKFNYNIIIRKDFVELLNLKEGDKIKVIIKEIKNINRTKELFCNNKIDLLNLIPKKTSCGYEIIVTKIIKNDEEWLRIWYSHDRGSGRQLEIRRFVDIKKFGSLLGQYQAEGTKNKSNKSKSLLRFTNKTIEEHIDYLNSLYDLGIQKDDIEIRFTYDPKLFSNTEIDSILLQFTSKTMLSIKVNSEEDLGGWAFATIIRNTILTEIILYSMDKIRNMFAKSKSNGYLENYLLENFLSKLLQGDGTLDVTMDKKYNYPEIKIKIVDQDLNYLNDYKHILQNLNFKVCLNEKHIFVRSSCGINHLFFLYKIKAFKNSNNWNKLLIAIDLALNGRRLSTLKRYLDLVKYQKFSASQVAKLYNIVTRSSYYWLQNATNDGYILKINENGKEIYWETTEKAKIFTKFLKIIQNDINELKSKIGTEDSKVILKSLKLKNKN